MRRFSTVYFTGPDPWVPDAERMIARVRRRVEAQELVFLGAKASRGYPEGTTEADARRIYTEVLADVRRADVVIANLTPWRGAGPHPEAAYLAGFASGLQKPVFAYLNVPDEEEAELLRRVERRSGARRSAEGVWRDEDGARIEDFGLPETLVLWAEARRFFIVVTPDLQGELTGVELCLEALKLYED